MPTYNYRCTKCEKIFDAFHSMMCTDPQFCPECGAPANKLLSASSVIFKGSGFYSTDYRDSGYLEAKKKDGSNGSAPKSDSGSDSSSTTGSKTETAPATTPATKPEPAATTTKTAATTTATPTAQAA